MKLLQDFTDRITDILFEQIQNSPCREFPSNGYENKEFTIKVTPYFRKELSLSWGKQMQGVGSASLNQICLITGNILNIETDLMGVSCISEITLSSLQHLSALRGRHTKQTEKEIADQINDLRDWER